MIETFIYTILVIYGVNKTTDFNMIFEDFRLWIQHLVFVNIECDDLRSLKTNLKYKLMKVLFDCTPCMSSFYGSISFFFTDLSWYYLPVWILSLCGAITLLNRLTK
jgi:hypothetical protein